MTNPADNAQTHRRPTRRITGIILAAVILAVAFGGITIVALRGSHAGAAEGNCAANPSACGYPDATNTGVPSSTQLLAVPGQISSGPGWKFNSGGWVDVSGNGATLSGLSIPYNLNISASNVTINHDQVSASGSFGISLRHTSGVTIENSTINGQNATSGRVDTAIDDVYGDSSGINIQGNNIYNFRTGINVSGGVIQGNYIHSPGYVSRDHTNGIYNNDSTTPLTISGNTIFNPLSQTDAITLESSGPNLPVANKTVRNNLLAGGGYALYGGASNGNPTSNIVITDNRFGQQYFPQSGSYGPVAYFKSSGAGNVWSGNVWDSNSQAVATP